MNSSKFPEGTSKWFAPCTNKFILQNYKELDQKNKYIIPNLKLTPALEL